MRTGSAALAWSIQESRHPTLDLAGYCLLATRLAFDVDDIRKSAIKDWKSKAKEHRFTSWPPPAATTVYWDIGRNGHVAPSAGDGYVWSTDILRTGKIDKVKISYINQHWGAKYLGWSDTVNGVDIYNPPPGTGRLISLDRLVAATEHDVAAAQGAGLFPDDVRPVERALVQVGLLDDRWVDGAWGTRTRKAIRAYRARYPELTWREAVRKLSRDTGLYRTD